MTTAGWLIAATSWAVIIGLNIFCFARLLTEKPAEPVTTVVPASDPEEPPAEH